MKPYDVLFIHPPRLFQKDWSGSTIGALIPLPMGVFALADLCQREGYETRMLNVPLELALNPRWDFAAFLRRHPARIYAIDLHWFATSYGAIAAARQCKAINPEARVLLGGHTASFFADEILRTHSAVDAIIRGEAEAPLLGYLRELKHPSPRFHDVPNLSYRTGSRPGTEAPPHHNPITYVATAGDLARLNFVNLPLLEHWREYPKVIDDVLSFCIMVARGCPFNCPFCSGSRDSTAYITGRRQVLLRDPAAVAGDIAYMTEQGLTKRLYMGHGLYPASEGYWLRVFREVRDRGVSPGVHLEIWRLPASRAVLQAFQRTFNAEASSVYFSLHSLDPAVRQRLAVVLKDSTHTHTNAQFRQLLDYCRDLELELRLWFTIGNPFQNVRDVFRGLSLVGSITRGTLAHHHAVQLFTTPITPSPGSPVFRFPHRFGVKLHLRTFADYYRTHGSKPNRFFTLDEPLAYETNELPHAQLELLTTLTGVLVLPTYLVKKRPRVETASKSPPPTLAKRGASS